MVTRVWMLVAVLLMVNIAIFAQAQLPPEVYTTPGPHVVVNGQLVRAPIQNVNGRLLLPLRAVFEALQSEVQWFAATQQVTATRGTSVVQLWIGRTTALVNGRQLPLDVPPRLIGGATYVPLRFPAEAFGGNVVWDPTTQTAIITIPPIGTPPPTTTLTGTLLDVRTTNGQTLIVQEQGTNTIVAIALAANAVITRALVNVQPQLVAVTSMQTGDRVVITRNTTGQAMRVDATYQQVSGRAAGVSANRLLLQDGTVYDVRPEARITNAAGTVIPLNSIQPGAQVTLRVTPGTTLAWSIVVTTATSGVSVNAVSAVNYTRPLRAGETLTIRVTGTPGADAATARVDNLQTTITLGEQSSGVYLGQWIIPVNVNVTDAPIFARLRVGTVTSPEVRSTQTITLDTLPPVISNPSPANNTQVADRNPIISADFDDRGGSGIDPQGVRLRVNNTDVSAGALISQTGVSYQASNLPNGQITVRLEVADRAGNINTAVWRFTVAPGSSGQLQIISVSHNAVGAVQPGQQVTFTARLNAAPARLEWYLDNTLVATGGTRVGNTFDYTRSYTIRTVDPTGTRVLRVRAYDGAGNSVIQEAVNPLVIGTASQTFRITTPADGTVAPDALVISGTAPAGSRVRVTVTYQGTIVVVPTQGQLFQGTVSAGTNGVWSTQTINLSVSLVDVQTYTIRAELLDAQGNVVQTDTVTLSNA